MAPQAPREGRDPGRGQSERAARVVAARRLPGLDSPQEARRRIVPRPSIDPEAFGRLSEGFARFMGTPRFLLYMSCFIVLWVVWNTLAPSSLRFDPYAFLFLTLILSLQASYAAPLILLAQNRQDDRDRVALEQDRQRAERNLADTEYLAREVAALRIAMREVATRDFIRSELRAVVEELDGEGEGGRPRRDRDQREGEPRPKRKRQKGSEGKGERPGARREGPGAAPTLEG